MQFSLKNRGKAVFFSKKYKKTARILFLNPATATFSSKKSSSSIFCVLFARISQNNEKNRCAFHGFMRFCLISLNKPRFSRCSFLPSGSSSAVAQGIAKLFIRFMRVFLRRVGSERKNKSRSLKRAWISGVSGKLRENKRDFSVFRLARSKGSEFSQKEGRYKPILWVLFLKEEKNSSISLFSSLKLYSNFKRFY